jgi:5-dehydro-4-deoxyglucarate dehydratase
MTASRSASPLTRTESADDETSRASATSRLLQDRLTSGLPSFPLTSFTPSGTVDLEVYRQHLRRQLASSPAAIFPCCGTGEFFSLSEPEYAELVAAAVEETAGQIPVVAGVGYGWAQAARFAAIAEAAGADGALVHPHYLVSAPQSGLVHHVRELAARTQLPLIVYQRGGVKYTAASVVELARIPTVIGLKDGHGDLDQLQRLRLAAPTGFLFMNGAPTAEMQARAYSTIGISAYSSSVSCFVPEIATAFFLALQAGETDVMERLLSVFYWPFAELRDRCAGYAVSLVKAGARLRGEAVGSVRAPLVDPPADDLAALKSLIQVGLDSIGLHWEVER